jgi:hypothetical protein
MLIVVILTVLIILPFLIPISILNKIQALEELKIILTMLWLFNLMILISVIVALACIHFCANDEKKYKELEYSTLTLVIQDNRIDGKTAEQIVKYNYKITMARERKDSLWVGWFYPDVIAELPLIEINENVKVRE